MITTVNTSWIALFSSDAPASPAALPVSDPVSASRTGRPAKATTAMLTTAAPLTRAASTAPRPDEPSARALSPSRASSAPMPIAASTARTSASRVRTMRPGASAQPTAPSTATAMPIRARAVASAPPARATATRMTAPAALTGATSDMTPRARAR